MTLTGKAGGGRGARVEASPAAGTGDSTQDGIPGQLSSLLSAELMVQQETEVHAVLQHCFNFEDAIQALSGNQRTSM